MPPIPNIVTVQVDSREKYPVLFPKHVRTDTDPGGRSTGRIIEVRTETTTLDAGDYRLAEFPDCCVIERKGSVLELLKNLYDHRDMVRMGKALKRLVDAAKYPYLLLEPSISRLMSRTHRASGQQFVIEPELLLDRLMRVVQRYGLRLLWLPGGATTNARRTLGTCLVHLMLNHAIFPTIETDGRGGRLRG